MSKKIAMKPNFRSISRSAAFIPFALPLAAAFFIVLSGVAYADLTNTTTNPADVQSGGQQGAVSHLIKKETVAAITSLKLGAYYDTAGGTGKQIQIRYSNIGNQDMRKKCLIIDSIANGGGRMTVRLDSTPWGGGVAEYTIPMNRMCANLTNAPGNANPESDVHNNSTVNSNSNRFFGNYALPSVIGLDPITNKYRVDVTIAYSSDVRTGESSENSVNFIVRAAGGTAKIGPLGAASLNQFGIRSAYVDERETKKGVIASTRFGVPCDVNDRTFDVRLFDPDVHQFGQTLMWLTENGVKLPLNRYNPGQSRLVNWVPSEGAFESLGDFSSAVSSLQVNQAVKGAEYEYFIRNDPHQDAPADQQGNVLSLDIPYDAIYADIECDYQLTPTIQVSGRYEYFPSVGVTGAVTKSGSATTIGAHPWEIYAVRYNTEPNLNISGDANVAAACSRVQATGRIGGCERIYDNIMNNADVSHSMTYTDGGPDDVGTNLCFFTRVQNPTQSTDDDTTWRYSDMLCAKSGIYPRLQIWGNDARTLSTINTSKSYLQSQQYGSWGEYGLFSGGLNTNMASGNGLLRGSVTTTQVGWSTLTFANSPQYGSFGAMSHPVVTEAATAPDPRCQFDADGTTFPIGAKCVIRISGKLTITDNLTYDNGPYGSISGIPRVIIIADNIEIDGDVTRIDPWIVAAGSNPATSGKISTCSQANNGVTTFTKDPINLTANLCRNRLTFNGSVIADTIYLHRTTEAGVTEDTPAELFNLRPDAYLSAYAGASGSGPVATTDSIVELPPRF